MPIRKGVVIGRDSGGLGMAAGVSYYNNGSIGRMFARQNVPSVYGRQKAVENADIQEEIKQVDQVSLSAQAPKPLTADFIKNALDAGETIAAGEPLSEESESRVRLDRVFAAVSALALLGHDGDQPASWPGGIPAPSKSELEAARRRLAQRPQHLEQAAEPEQIQNRRVELVEKITRRDLGQDASRLAAPAAQTMAGATPSSG